MSINIPEIQFFKSHERLLLILATIALFLFLGNKYLNNSAQEASIKAALAEKQLQTDIAANQRLTADTFNQNQKLQTLVESVTVQNQQLVLAVRERDSVLKRQQEAEKVMPLPDLAVRWENLLKLSNDEIQNVNGNLVVSDNASRITVQELEEVPVLKENLKQEQFLSTQKDQALQQANITVKSFSDQISGLNIQIKDADKACKAQVSSVKANARKSKRNFFITGLLVGAGLVAKFGGLLWL